MTARRRRMLDDLQLRGLSPRTQPCDLEAVPHLAQHDRRAPDSMSAAELRHDFLSLLTETQVAERTFRLHLSGSRCFYARTRKRPGPVCERIRPRPRHTRPVVLSPQEVRSLLALGQRSNARLCLQML